MKKHIYILHLLFFCFTAGAQNISDAMYSEPRVENGFEHLNWLYALSNNKKIKTYEGTTSKDKNSRDFFALDENGREVELRYEYKSSFGPFKIKHFNHRKFEYKGNLHVKTESFNKKGEPEYSFVNDYFAPGKVNHGQTFYKGKLKGETFTNYNPDSTVKDYTSYILKKGEKRTALRYEYDYYPDKQRKQARMYDRHNKLKYTWKYDCNPKGEVIQPKTLQVCRNTGTDNKGRSMEVLFYTNHKGKKSKTVHTYYEINGKKHTVLTENFEIKKDGKERKLNEFHLPDSLEKFYYYKYFNKEGNVEMENRIDYVVCSSQQKIIGARSFTTYNKKGKTIVAFTSEFNERGIPISAQNKVRNKITSKAVYKIENENLYTVTRYNKKGKVAEIFTNRIEYYQ